MQLWMWLSSLEIVKPYIISVPERRVIKIEKDMLYNGFIGTTVIIKL